MTRSKEKEAEKELAIRLRTEEGLSINRIRERVPTSRPTLRLWLRPHPIAAQPVGKTELWRASMKRRRKDRGIESPAHRAAVASGVAQTSSWKGRLAEAAVLWRLVLHGYDPLRAVFDGDHVDWFVRVDLRRIARVQVRWAASRNGTLPAISLRRKGKARKPFEPGSVDVFVAYDLFTDTAYVFAWNEVETKGSVTVRPDAAERWDKLQLQGVA